MAQIIKYVATGIAKHVIKVFSMVLQPSLTVHFSISQSPRPPFNDPAITHIKVQCKSFTKQQNPTYMSFTLQCFGKDGIACKLFSEQPNPYPHLMMQKS